MLFRILFLYIISIGLLACEGDVQEAPKPDPNWNQDESIRMNATFAAEETEAIDAFLSRRPDWKMSKTGTGLRYFIYDSTKNEQPEVGDIVWVNFTVSLLDNKICYTSKRGEPESFMIEKSDIESGIHEGVQLLAIGERAKFILPSHLAHGLIGDLDQIPPLETVVYDIELVNFKSPDE